MSNEVILRFLADTKQLDAAYARVAGRTSALNKTLNSIGGFGSVATKAGRSLTHGITIPLIALGTAAGVLGYKWDQTWTRIRSLTNLTGREVETAKAKVLGLASTGVAPQRLAEGFYFLASAGLSTAGALDALNYSAKGAGVGLGDFESLSKSVALSMNVWKDKNLSAAQSIDIMIAAVKAGTMEPDKMATNLGKVAGQAAAVGMTMRETAGAMAAMTNAGLSVEASAVGLGQVINHISKPTKAAKEEADKLGLSFEGLTATIKKKGLMAALTEMQDKTHGNDKSIRTLLANQQAIRAYYGLMKNGGKDTADVMDQMGRSTGSLGVALKTTAESPAHKMQVALAHIKAEGIKWGQVLLPKVAQIMDKVSQLSERLSKLTPQQREAALKFAAIAAAIGPSLYVIGKLASGFALVGKNWRSAGFAILLGFLVRLYASNSDFRDSVNDLAVSLSKAAVWVAKHQDLMTALGATIATFTVGMKLAQGAQVAWTVSTVAWSAATKGASAALAVYRMGVAVAAMEGKAFTAVQGLMAVGQWALNAAFLASPVVWVVAGLALLVGGFIYAWKHSEKFRNVTKDTWATIQRGAGTTVKYVLPVVKALVLGVLDQFGMLIDGAALLFGWVPGIGDKLKGASDAFSTFRDDVGRKFDEIAAAAGGWGRAVNNEYVNGIRTTNSALIAAAANSAKAVKDAYADPDKYWREAGAQNVSAYAKGMKDNASKAAIQAAANSTAAAQAAKVRAHELMVNLGVTAGSEYAHGMSNTAGKNRTAGESLAAAAYSGATPWTPKWLGLGEDASSGFARGIGRRASDAVTAASNLAQRAVEAARKAQDSHSPSKVTMALGRDFGRGYALGITAEQAGITRTASVTVQKLAAALKKAQAKVASETRDLYDSQHPGRTASGKPGKVNATTVRHQREQLAAAKKHAADIAKQLKRAQLEDDKLRKRRATFFPDLVHGAAMLKPWSDMASAAEGPVSKAATALAGAITKHFADKNGALPAAVKAMRDNLLKLAKDAAELHQSVFDGLTSGASLTSAFGGQDATTADMQMFLAQKVADMKELGTDLTALAKRGVPTSLLRQFALAGPEALPMMRSLLGASNTDFAALVESQRQVDQLANATASAVESAVYGQRPAAAVPAQGRAVSIGNVQISLAVPAGTDGRRLANDLMSELKSLGGA